MYVFILYRERNGMMRIKNKLFPFFLFIIYFCTYFNFIFVFFLNAINTEENKLYTFFQKQFRCAANDYGEQDGMNETNISEMRMRLGNPGNCFVLRDEFEPEPKITFKMCVCVHCSCCLMNSKLVTIR